jgi:hypothetical protein
VAVGADSPVGVSEWGKKGKKIKIKKKGKESKECFDGLAPLGIDDLFLYYSTSTTY